MTWLIREYQHNDLEGVMRLWESVAGGEEQLTVFSMAECVGALNSREPAVVATSGGRIIGACLATVAGDRAWVMRIGRLPEFRGRRMTSALLTEIERLSVERGARRMAYVLPEEEQFSEGLVTAGYSRKPAVAYFEKVEGLGPGEASMLEELGGRVLPSGLWDRISGMEREKGVIENRVVLPLAHPERAAAHGVLPPHAIVLFGPPGTGKTTFARGIASRLAWPFVEVFPSRLAVAEGGLANALREVFAKIHDLERVVVFLDEVEEIAPQRGDIPTTAAHGVTNELLKLIPTFRERQTRLLVAATNSVRSLDSAFLRPGRFDYLIPVGPPDANARRALWTRFIQRTARTDVDLDRLVDMTDGFTPADIEYAARIAAQSSFEREVVAGQVDAEPGASTADYLSALAGIRPTVTRAIQRDFDEDIEAFARV
ncbi:MAG: GNAT family N-acetyltransferase [Candidatus Nanopelagicales bacterium]